MQGSDRRLGEGQGETELNHCKLERGAVTTYLVDLQGRGAGSGVAKKGYRKNTDFGIR